ncbi:hypothetical protein AAG906_039323 [Vitis piasezkii]
MVAHVWESNTYIEEVGHQSSLINYVIFYLSIHLDDEVRNPDPQIAAHAREFGVNVDFTSAGQSSRLNSTGTFASGCHGSRGGTDDRGDNMGGDIGEHQQSQYPMSQFTYENDFTHYTQDEDHGFRRVGRGIGAIGKP